MTAAALVVLALLAQQAARPAPKPQPSATVPDRETLLQQAAAAQKAGRAPDAMRLYGVAAEKHQSVAAYLELARLQSRAGQGASALASLEKARDIAPNSEDVLSAYAQLAMAAKQPLPAVLALEPLTRMHPLEPQYHYLLGVGLMALGDMPSATEALSTANTLEPDRALTLLAYGLALNNRKMFDEAKSALQRSIELQPDSVEAIAALAEAEAGLGNYDTAATFAGRALARAPSNATALLVNGMVLLEQRKYPEARDVLLRAAETDPDSPKTVYQLSLVYARLGDEAEARRYVELYRARLQAMEKRVETLRGEK